jgi:putative oxidoreductase
MAVALARVLLGALLVWAGAAKIGHPEALAVAIAGFRLLPPGLVAPLAVILPFFEVLLGLYLVVGLFTRVVAAVAAAQFVIYAMAIASAVLRDIPANCGCFGPGDTAVADWPHVAFDLVLAAVALFIAAGAPGAYALDRRLRPR